MHATESPHLSFIQDHELGYSSAYSLCTTVETYINSVSPTNVVLLLYLYSGGQERM